MKTVFRVLALFVMVASMSLMTSCSKEKTIVGKWKCDNAMVTIPGMEDIPEVQEILEYFQEEMAEEYKGMVWEFRSDNTLVLSGEGVDESDFEDVELRYTVNDNKLTITAHSEDEDVEDDVTVFNIQTLTNEKLELDMSETEEGVTVNLSLSFNRI